MRFECMCVYGFKFDTANLRGEWIWDTTTWNRQQPRKSDRDLLQ